MSVPPPPPPRRVPAPDAGSRLPGPPATSGPTHSGSSQEGRRSQEGAASSAESEGPQLQRLTHHPSPYSVLMTVTVVAIMVAPNFVFFLLDQSLGVEADIPVEASEGQIVFSLLFAMILQLLLFGAAMLPLLIRRQLDRRLFGPAQPTGSWSALGLGLAAGIVTLFIAYGVNIALVAVFGAENAVEQQLIQDALTGGFSLLLAGLLAIVVAPFVEEVVFRGVLFRSLDDRFGLVVGAVLSSAIFAFIHVEVVTSQPLALGGLFAVGLVLALSYHFTGNLLIPILGHAVFNASSLAFALVADRLLIDDLVASIALATTGLWP